MATTNTIGTTGRNYSTLQAWEDAVPATPTGGYIGECYNDSEFTANLIIDGHTTSAANFIKLTAATGQSFADHASKATNPLKYDQSKGVGIRANYQAGNGAVIESANDYVFFTRLQVKNDSPGYNGTAIRNVGTNVVGLTVNLIDQCICEGSPNHSANQARAVVILATGTMTNTAIICRRSTGNAGCTLGHALGTAGMYNCTVVTPSDLAGDTGIYGVYSGNEVKNCAVFGFTNDSANGTITITTSQTNDTTPRSGFTGSVTYANQFENTTNASGDFRIKAGAGLIDAGTDIHVAAPSTATDIIGTTRTTYDVGAWEVAGGGGGTTPLTFTATDSLAGGELL